MVPDATRTHSWNRWRYHYPQCAYPYQDLVAQNTARSRLQPEYELIDTGAFDSGRYWITEVHYAKAGPDDLPMQISVANAGSRAGCSPAVLRERARRLRQRRARSVVVLRSPRPAGG